jgi:ribonuclease J
MHAFSLIAQNMGAPKENVFELGVGQIVEFSNKTAKLGAKIHVKNVLVDGLGIGDVGNVVLRDRQVLAREGIAIVMIQLDKSAGKVTDDPEIISRGFIFNKEGKEFLSGTGKMLREKLNARKYVDSKVAREVTQDVLERFFFKETGRRPMVMPVVVEV